MTVSFTGLVGDALDRCGDHLELAVVPFVAALLQVHRIRNVLADPSDFRAGIAFPVPGPLLDVWSFTTTAGEGVNVTAPEPPFLFAYPVVVLVTAALTAVYVGSLDDVLRGREYDALANLRAYFVPFAAYGVLFAALGLGVVALGTVALAADDGAAVLLFVLLTFVSGAAVSYLFYAAPFLFVIEDCGFVSGFRRSYALAVDGGDYAVFWVLHVVVGVVTSLPTSLLVYNVPVLGILLGAAVGAFVGLGFTAATLLFLRRHVGADAGVAHRDAPGGTGAGPTTDPRATDGPGFGR